MRKLPYINSKHVGSTMETTHGILKAYNRLSQVHNRLWIPKMEGLEFLQLILGVTN